MTQGTVCIHKFKLCSSLVAYGIHKRRNTLSPRTKIALGDGTASVLPVNGLESDTPRHAKEGLSHFGCDQSNASGQRDHLVNIGREYSKNTVGQN
jgi:hypothetical protein